MFLVFHVQKTIGEIRFDTINGITCLQKKITFDLESFQRSNLNETIDRDYRTPPTPMRNLNAHHGKVDFIVVNRISTHGNQRMVTVDVAMAFVVVLLHDHFLSMTNRNRRVLMGMIMLRFYSVVASIDQRNRLFDLLRRRSCRHCYARRTIDRK